jgi:hypothetical protein
MHFVIAVRIIISVRVSVFCYDLMDIILWVLYWIYLFWLSKHFYLFIDLFKTDSSYYY